MRIIDNVRPDRQTVMFSATFPRQMEALARRILNKPIEVQVGGRSVVCKDVIQNVVSKCDNQRQNFSKLQIKKIIESFIHLIDFLLLFITDYFAAMNLENCSLYSSKNNECLVFS